MVVVATQAGVFNTLCTAVAEPITKNELNLKASAALHPLGRIGEASEVASAIAWLIDPEQKCVTGQVIGVDGGLASIQARPATSA